MSLQTRPNPRRNAALVLHFKEAVATRHAYIDFWMSEVDVGEWVIRIRDIAGNEDEFKGGEYLVRMHAQPSYPQTPPKFEFLTPNGVYEVKSVICIGVGHFHADKYAAASQKMYGFARDVLNGLIGWRDLGGGIGITSPQPLAPAKARFAAASVAYNRANYPDLVRYFERHPFTVLNAVLERDLNASRLPARARRLVRQWLHLDV